MGRRYSNYRRVKTHRSYTVEEVASLLLTHKNTVRRWLKAGLPACDDKRPVLILGHELIAFLRANWTKNRKVCGPGKVYCVRCRQPKYPAGRMADFVEITDKIGNLIAICPDCNSIINQWVSTSKLHQIRAILEIKFSPPLGRLSNTSQRAVNGDSA